MLVGARHHDANAFRVGRRTHRFDCRIDDRLQVYRLQLHAQLARDDARHVEDVFDELCLRLRVPVDDFEPALQARRVGVRIAEHRRPSQDRVERRAQLVRQRGEEFVLQAVRRFRLLARHLERVEQVAHFELPPARADRGAHEADRDRNTHGTIEQRDVGQLLEQREGATRGRLLLTAGEEQHGHIGPRWLRAERGRDSCEIAGLENLLGENDGGGAFADRLTHRRAGVADLGDDPRAATEDRA